MNELVLPFERVTMNDVEVVGGKNASIGEMIGALSKLGVKVPGGFATTADAYRRLLAQGGLDERIRLALADLDVDDVVRLAEVGAQIRGWILETPLQPELEQAVLEGYRRFGPDAAVAVRSSATAEDLPEASFAGQQETFLNVQGEAAVIEAMRHVFASLFNDRAIAYRVHQGFDHSQVALSAGIQQMVRSDRGASGVMFTLDTDSGFRNVVFITASYGLGETVVQGAVNPDEFYLYKPAVRAGRRSVLRRNLGAKAIKMVYGEPGSAERVRTVNVPPADRQRFCLDDNDLTALARQALIIEEHYGKPMDIEWGKDGVDAHHAPWSHFAFRIRINAVRGDVANTGLNDEGGLNGRLVGVKRCKHQLWVDDLNLAVRLDVASGDRACPLLRKGELDPLLRKAAKANLLDVEKDLYDVFTDAWQRGELLHDAIDLHGGDCSTFQRSQENAAQCVAEGDAVAWREWASLVLAVRAELLERGDLGGQCIGHVLSPSYRE